MMGSDGRCSGCSALYQNGVCAHFEGCGWCAFQKSPDEAVRCTCDAFCDDPCPVHAKENREQDVRIRAANELAAVNHPAHYGGKDDPYETIKVLKAWMFRLNLSGYQGGLYFNVVKYLSRAGLKGSRLQDLKKARFYLDELVADVEKEAL